MVGDDDDDILAGIVEDLNETRGSASFLEDSFSSEVGQQATSTPVRARTSAGPSTSRLSCPECSNTYANERTLQVHVKMHKMKGASSRVPSKEEILNAASEHFTEVVRHILKEEERVGVYPETVRYCKVLLEDSDISKRTPFLEFIVTTVLNCIHSQNAILPSALRSSLYTKFNTLMHSAEFRQKCTEALFYLHATDPETCHLFLGPMIIGLVNKILAFIVKHMRGISESDADVFQRSSDNVNSTHFQQVVYYVSGFIINSIAHMAQSDKPSRSWSAYLQVINNNFLTSAGNECSKEVSLFSQKKDRGGLKHCSAQAFDFFLVLFDLLNTLENAEGSLSFDLVDEKVSNHDVLLLLWDDLVSTHLTEQEGLNLLLIVVNSCTKTANRGILKRRLNEEFSKSETQVAFRPRLAR